MQARVAAALTIAAHGRQASGHVNSPSLGCCIEPFSFFSISGWGIDLDYCDTEWFTMEMNRDHSVVFETT